MLRIEPGAAESGSKYANHCALLPPLNQCYFIMIFVCVAHKTTVVSCIFLKYEILQQILKVLRKKSLLRSH